MDLDLAGVVYTCGPLNAPFMAPPEAYAHFPQFNLDGVKARMGMPLDISWEDFAEGIRTLSIENISGFDGPMIDTPLLAINTNDDPVAPVEEMDRLLARASNSERVVLDIAGHCPPDYIREPLVAAWIRRHLR